MSDSKEPFDKVIGKPADYEDEEDEKAAVAQKNAAKGPQEVPQMVPRVRTQEPPSTSPIRQDLVAQVLQFAMDRGHLDLVQSVVPKVAGRPIGSNRSKGSISMGSMGS